VGVRPGDLSGSFGKEGITGGVPLEGGKPVVAHEGGVPPVGGRRKDIGPQLLQELGVGLAGESSKILPVGVPGRAGQIDPPAFRGLCVLHAIVSFPVSFSLRSEPGRQNGTAHLLEWLSSGIRRLHHQDRVPQGASNRKEHDAPSCHCKGSHPPRSFPPTVWPMHSS